MAKKAAEALANSSDNDAASNPIERLIQQNNLEFVKVIGKGENGFACLYKYLGNNQKIRGLTNSLENNSYVIIKRLNNAIEKMSDSSVLELNRMINGDIVANWNELQAYKYLEKLDIADKHYPESYTLQDDQNNFCLLMQYIAYGKNKAGMIFAEDVSAFIKSCAKTARVNQDKKFLMFLVVQLFSSIKKAHTQLLNLGLIHGDLGERNCLIKSIDLTKKEPIEVDLVDLVDPRK